MGPYPYLIHPLTLVSGDIYQVPMNYASGSTSLIKNGLVIPENSLEWEELGTNQIRLLVTPLPGDILQLGYIPI